MVASLVATLACPVTPAFAPAWPTSLDLARGIAATLVATPAWPAALAFAPAWPASPWPSPGWAES
ncbi:hypothetical protein HaLaN_16862 [Haematococcus lacustris]|uniref:Uncharacterized protein n=1 Tax=Haematococcus lacustris TaxID=44745 RepID=A0A699ZCL1_HAELA|nr:hypothetical protein HaLaN_16862 [Haematococcus lacustris]